MLSTTKTIASDRVGQDSWRLGIQWEENRAASMDDAQRRYAESMEWEIRGTLICLHWKRWMNFHQGISEARVGETCI